MPRLSAIVTTTLALSTKSINVFNVNTYDMMVWELSNRSHCVIMLLSEFMLIKFVPGHSDWAHFLFF